MYPSPCFLGNEVAECLDFAWALKTLTHQGFEVTTGDDGGLWLIVGTDSGFEGETRLYYTTIEVTLTPLPST